MKSKTIKKILIGTIDLMIIIAPFYLTGTSLNIVHYTLLTMWALSGINLIFYPETVVKMLDEENEGILKVINILICISLIVSWGYFHHYLLFSGLIILHRLGILYRLAQYKEGLIHAE